MIKLLGACKKVRCFKYRGKKYIIAECEINLDKFYGAYKQINNIQVCIVNSFLNKDKKLRTIHHLIKNKKCKALI